MKNYVILAACTVLFSMSCKQKKDAQQTSNLADPAAIGATTGKVSHQYRSSGCSTVVVVNNVGDELPMILIPKDKLPAKMDVDGMEITFNYTPLKMPQPAGCAQGIPADIKDVASKK